MTTAALPEPQEAESPAPSPEAAKGDARRRSARPAPLELELFAEVTERINDAVPKRFAVSLYSFWGMTGVGSLFFYGLSLWQKQERRETRLYHVAKFRNL